MSTPDFMEALVGSRLWLTDKGLLFSVVFTDVVWEPYRMLTSEPHTLWLHTGPIGHGPGIYTYKSVNHLFRDTEVSGLTGWLTNMRANSRVRWRLVGGSVSVWGTVEEHEDGYIAQYAYPKEFIALQSFFGELGANSYDVEILAHQFGVPIATEETHEAWKARADYYRGAPTAASSYTITSSPIFYTAGYWTNLKAINKRP